MISHEQFVVAVSATFLYLALVAISWLVVKLIRRSWSWRALQRWFDTRFLWPICKNNAESLDRARTLFIACIRRDAHWADDFSGSDLWSHTSSLL